MILEKSWLNRAYIYYKLLLKMNPFANIALPFKEMVIYSSLPAPLCGGSDSWARQ